MHSHLHSVPLKGSHTPGDAQSGSVNPSCWPSFSWGLLDTQASPRLPKNRASPISTFCRVLYPLPPGMTLSHPLQPLPPIPFKVLSLQKETLTNPGHI